jgi:hypothetical protein
LQGDPAAALHALEVAIPRARQLRLDQLGYLLCAKAGALSFMCESTEELFAEAGTIAPAPDLLLLMTATIRADIAMRHRRYEEAVTHYLTASGLLENMPGVAPMDAPCFLVRALAALGRTDDAKAALRRAGTAADNAQEYKGITSTLLYAAPAVVIVILLITYRSPVRWLLPVVSSWWR